MDISNLSVEQLEALKSQLPHEIEKRKAAGKAEVVKEIEALAKQRGYTLDELFSGRGRKAGGKDGRGKVAVKYRHPQNAQLAWTGRGRKPVWVEEWLGKGGTLDGLKI